MGDSELYELVSSPLHQQVADCIRVVLSFAGVPQSAVRDAVLEGPALREYLEASKHGNRLPVFVDFAKRIDLNRPAAILRYIGRLGGVSGASEADSDWASLCAETVVEFIQAESQSAASAFQFFSELQVTFDMSMRHQAGLTYGDALLWFAASLSVRSFGSGVLAGARSLRELIDSLGRDSRLVAAAQRLGWGDVPVVRPVRSAASAKGPVLVTGASGFIASWVVAILLERGYTVHATVRRLSDGAKHAHLLSLPGASSSSSQQGLLRLFEADLLDEGSFAAAAAGCTGVLHCASPFFMIPKVDAHAELIRPAVEGTRNVLRTCIAEASVQRVVMTSSVAACYVSRAAPDHWYTEDDWVSVWGRGGAAYGLHSVRCIMIRCFSLNRVTSSSCAKPSSTMLRASCCLNARLGE